MKYVVCYSGGNSSALVAIEAVKKYGSENIILLNHNICGRVEHEDIKRFKDEIAEYLDIEITYANMKGWEEKDQFDVCVGIGAFKVGTGTELCTNRMKTEPFEKWLKYNYPVSPGETRQDITLLYGFDPKEKNRTERRERILGMKGYLTDFPLSNWKRTLSDTEEIGIKKPITYNTFKHANCVGCLKAGKQHWYIVYSLYPEIWKKAKWAESQIGYSIIKGTFLKDLEPKFASMKERGIVPTEKIKPQTFWKLVRKELLKAKGTDQSKLTVNRFLSECSFEKLLPKLKINSKNGYQFSIFDFDEINDEKEVSLEKGYQFSIFDFLESK